MSKIELYNADCLEQMKEIPDKSIDMILCDLPYEITSLEWDKIIPFDRLWEQYNRIIKDGRAIVLFGSQPFTSKLICSNIKNFKYELIWKSHKGKNPLLAKIQPMKIHENICVFGKGKILYNPQMTNGTPYNKRGSHNIEKAGGCILANKPIKYAKDFDSSKRYPTTLLEFSNHNQGKNRLHPTQKPVALLEYLIKTYTNENDTVLDNCMGSGSTGVACKHMNRNFIGIEIVEDYFNIAKERIDKE